MPAVPAAMTPAAARALALAAGLGLAALCIAWELWLAPTGRGTLALKALPLVPALAGLFADRLHTYRWTALLVWAYVAEGLVRATSERAARPFAVAEIAIALVLFAACVARVRAARGAAAS